MRRFIPAIEIAVLCALILATRCANYADVFVGGNVYFTDADCYSRMTRVQLCARHPGLVVRHHDFENYPAGTTPHTTAPLDYLILGLALLLRPLTAQPLDLAGALISPMLALAGGLFLWWWFCRTGFRYRWVGLILYAISPILVHGTELGRPDHQSLLMLLIAVGLCAEWTYRREKSPFAALVSGATWALALWVSAYEPLILFVLLLGLGALANGASFFHERKFGWVAFGVIIVIALLLERRLPAFSIQSGDLFRNWSRTIGELSPVSLFNPVWFRWAGYLIAVAPVLIWMSKVKIGTGETPLFMVVILAVTFGLTIWQARWSYFFVTIFAILLPALLNSITSRAAVWIAFSLSLFPILRDWDERLWPNESAFASQIEHRSESAQLREMALTIRSSEAHPFLAPWWLSPEISYWSGQAGIAGSSHESMEGIADSARFYLTADADEAAGLLSKHRVEWVFAYDSERVSANSEAILAISRLSGHPLCEVLDRTPAQAPGFLILAGQTAAAKLFRVVNKR